MRFLLTTNGDSSAPDEAMMAEMGAFIEEMTRSGVLLATGGLEPGGVRMTSRGGEVTVTDGPFAESKEAIVSFALVETRSREEAIELARRFWKIVGDGQGAVQQVFGPEDAPR
ncbi:YciI family protein [Microbispora amethystogenes]|uniref:YciI family protein n=1 Tax=Microbispora amethystogenes TaxID=1427754 RepID=UPI0033FE318A